MIGAEQRAAAEYRQLTEFWGVAPHLGALLGEEFAARVAAGVRVSMPRFLAQACQD